MNVRDLGPTALKNIAEPLRVYSVEVGKPAPRPSRSPRREADSFRRPPRAALLVAGGPRLPMVGGPAAPHDTTLLPTTDPFGSGQMMHVVTDSGDYRPAEQGNGFAQAFIGGALLPHATVDL